MKLSRTVSYAVQATLQLAQAPQGATIPCSKLAATGHMPERFLLQILRNLVTHGILQSIRGVEGGYTLERDPSTISLLEVIEAVDGPLQSNIPASEYLPEEAQQKLQNALLSVTERTRKELEQIKLSALVAPGKRSS
jgi:Rrf2 family transcriptional regulator, cysteine metabolism repressor